MNELVTVLRDDAVVSSLQVAKHFHKRHDNILRDIDKLIGGLLKIEETPQGKMFYKSSYTERFNAFLRKNNLKRYAN